MAEAIFIYEGESIKIQCNKNQKMEDICKALSININTNLNSLLFLYGGSKLNLEKTYNEITEENKISILVYKTEIEICSKCGSIIDNQKIDNIISLNNNANYSLIGIKRQVEQVIKDIINKADINFINNQLNNINIMITVITDNIKKIGNELNQIKFNSEYSLKDKNNSNSNNNDNSPKNEIICTYNKQENEIDLLHNYNLIFKDEKIRKQYLEGKNNINEKNIDIYINDKKIPFNYKYKSNEKGDIKVKFIFNKLLTNTCFMFSRCSSLTSIDLSSFNSSNINDMVGMFSDCSSLKSIDLSSFNSSNINNLSGMIYKCPYLKKENIKFNNSDKKLFNLINELIIN